MTNIDKVSAALGEWAFTVAKSVLPKMRIAPNSPVGHLMGIIGADPTTYNIWNELGFLAEPLIQTMVTPAVQKMLGSIPDEQVPELAMKFVDCFIEQAGKKGTVDLFGLGLSKDAFEGLRSILSAKLEE